MLNNEKHACRKRSHLPCGADLLRAEGWWRCCPGRQRGFSCSDESCGGGQPLTCTHPLVSCRIFVLPRFLKLFLFLSVIPLCDADLRAEAVLHISSSHFCCADREAGFSPGASHFSSFGLSGTDAVSPAFPREGRSGRWHLLMTSVTTFPPVPCGDGGEEGCLLQSGGLGCELEIRLCHLLLEESETRAFFRPSVFPSIK